MSECKRCGRTFDVPYGLEVTEYCNLCAQTIIVEQAEQIAIGKQAEQRLLEQCQIFEAENKRLKEALEDLIDSAKGHYRCSRTGLDGCERCHTIEQAEQALAAQPQKER